MSVGHRSTFGAWLMAQREAHNISRFDLAASVGIWPEALWQIERLGHPHAPRMRVLLKTSLQAIIDKRIGADYDKASQ